MTARITDTDKGMMAVAARLIGRHRVTVGVLSDGVEKNGKSIIEVAAIQEFGAPAANIPQRSYLRATVDEKRAEIQATQLALAKQIVFKDLDGRTAMDRLGARVAGLIQRRIAQGIPPPNAPSTIAKKHSSTPLIDEGQLRGAISYKVESD